MSEGIETVLRKSLDAVDQNRRRLLWLLAIAGVTVVWQFYRLLHIAPTGDVPRLIVSAVMLLSSWILGLAVVLAFQLTVSTKRILRAIELASKAE